MSTDRDRPKAVHDAARRLEQFLAALSPADWDRPSACEGWTVADVVAHLAERGISLPERIKRGLAGDMSPPPGSPSSDLLNEDQFRESIDQSAVALRKNLGDNLLSAFIDGNNNLDKLLEGTSPEDWDQLCHHWMGPESLRALVDIRTAELAMHEWDIRSVFDPNETLMAQSLSALVNTVPRAVRRAFRPDASRTRPVRYRFRVTDRVATTTDVLLTKEGSHFETSAEGQAEVVFRCDTTTYVMVMFGRLKVDAAIVQGFVTTEGAERLIEEFVHAFVGG